jgi:nucleoside-diphosphate-sugar epimerase
VSDFTAPGAFDEAAKGAIYIIHIASPLPPDSAEGIDLIDVVVKPAVEGTLNVLRAAKKSGTVRRVVITSSAVATVPTAMLMGQPFWAQVFGPDNRVDEIPGEYITSSAAAYLNSKIAALNRAEAWMKTTELVSFDLVHIHPSFVFGREDMTTTVAGFQSGTKKQVLGPVLGAKTSQPVAPHLVHVDDVALAHVRALDQSKVHGGSSFLLSSTGQDGTEWDDSKKYAEKHFPDAVSKGLLSNGGTIPTVVNGALDTSATESVLGIKLKGYERMTVRVVGHFLEVLGKEGGKPVDWPKGNQLSV